VIPSSRNAIHLLNFDGDGDVGGGWAPAVNWWGTVYFIYLFIYFSNLVNFKILMISLILNVKC
jgi:hypothetical protein